MKKRFSLVLLLTFLMGVLPSSVAFSQTYTISPTSYTSKPSYQSLSNSWIGYTTGSNSIWIETKAVESGSSVVFYVRKSSGTFQNKVSFIIRRDVTVSGSTVTSEGTKVGSGSISAGKSSGTCTITPTSGSHEYRVILTSGSMTFYSRMVKINASSLATPDYTKFKATNITTTGFTANWSAVSGATQYDILVKKASDSDYSNPVYDGGTSSTSCKITGLQPNTSYQFQVRAKNSTQYSSWSKSIQTPVTTKANDLATPDYTKFKATNITTTGFTANWSAVSGATQYDILVKKASDGDYSNPVYDGGTSSTSCKITGLQPNTSYQFQVRAKNSTQYSSWSKSIQTPVTTKANDLATPDYTKFTATNITTTGFTANWSAVSGATQYDILVKKASDGDYSNPVYDGGTSSTSCKITGLQPNTSYQFQVRAKNSTQYSSWSKSIQTPVMTKAYDLDTPDHTKFSATNITTTGFTANWSAVSGATQYDILVKKASDSDYSNPVYDGGTSSTSCKITGLQPNTSYQFQVRAKNSTQYSSWSKSIQTPVTTKAYDLDTPDHTKFSATNITTTGFTANWSAVSGATQYDILVKKASDGDYSNPVYDGGTSSTSCKITGLQPNTSYQFQIRAKNSTQYSSWSKSIQTSITTLGEYTLDTPDYTQFTYSNVTSTGFRAKWSSVSRATKYNILVKKASDTNYSNPVYEAKNLTTTYCDVTGLQSKTAYQFQIQAINSTEKSSWSRSIQTSITTLGEKTLDTPDYTKFSATNITTTGFTANWSAVSGATQYDILVKKASDSDYSNPVFDGGTTSTSCKITGLQPKTSYQFQIRAKNSTQYSSWSKSIQTPITTKRESTYDVNNDGSIDNGDMNDLLGIVLGRDDGMDMDDFTFDTNDDGKVDVTDIVQLISMMNDVKEGRFHDIDEENEGGNVDPTETEQQIEQLPSDEDGTSETVYDEAESLEYDALAQEVISMYDTDDDSDYYGNEVNKTRASDDELAKEAIRKNGNNIFGNQLTIEQQNWDSKRWGNTRYGGFKTFYNTQVKNGRRYLLVVFYYKGGFPNKKTAYLKLGQLNNGKVISKSTIYSNQEYAVLRVCIDDYLQNYGCFNIFPMLITDGSNARNYLNPFLVKSNKIVDSDWRNKYYGYEFGKINGVSVYFNADTQKGNTNQGNGWHQCVELCKRYVTYLNGYLNRKETDTWGNAINWPANRANDAKDPGMYLVFANDGRERVREGDLIVWQYGTYGHIGVVISVKPDRISVAHQNGGKGTCASPIGTSMKLENGVIKDIVPGTNHSPIFKSIQYVPYFIRINSGGEHYVPYNASMSASTTNIKFNPTQSGKSLTKTFIIYNSKGMGTLNISSIAAKKGNGFSVDVTKCSIEPGGFQPVNVTFTPSASGEYKDLIMIQSDADDNPTWTIHLSGTGK